MHDQRLILAQRIERTLRERVEPARTTTLEPLRVSRWTVPLEAGEPRGTVGEPVSFDEAITAEYEPLEQGDAWGRPWETTWFRLDLTVPSASDLQLAPTDHLELVLDLGWQQHSPGFQAEGLVRDESGRAVKGVNPRNQWIPVPAPTTSPQSRRLWVEAAANPLLLAVPPFQMTQDGDKLTSGSEPIYRLAQADLVVVHQEVVDLSLDLAVLRELAESRSETDTWGWQVLLSLSEALDQLDLQDIPGTASRARQVLKPLLDTKPNTPSHRISAVGHAHIDSAWLWPIRETRRKVTRTLANVVRLIEDGTGLIFALPAAQHLAWLQEEDPDLFGRVKALVTSGQIVPVGGMWIEPDAVLPGGEALCRQLVEGLRFFEDELGATCQEIWLPDSFGYSGSLPQIAKLAGIDRFLTQKISWNQVNVFPHHTLWWEGIDGSRIFTHFPPVDTYGAEVTGANLAHAERNFKDKGRASCSLMPFGYGDGGGGPTREMVARVKRFSNLAGVPRTIMETPGDFFERAEADYPDAPVWVGELYLELHRGTFTSQIATKQGNRRAEALLREAELWATTAYVRSGQPYPWQELQKAWRAALLCQFHDILPGTSIAWVYREVADLYEQIRASCEEIIETSLDVLTTGDMTSVANPSSFAWQGVPPFGAASAVTSSTTTVSDRQLENGLIRAEFDDKGYLVALEDLSTGRNYIASGQRGGELHLHQDFPNMWDAWDLDPFYRGSQQELTEARLSECGNDGEVGLVRQQVSFGNSQAELVWRLRPGSRALELQVAVDWHEQEKLLKLAFPIDIHTDHAQYETQFGHIVRPTHENTSWDASRFEVSCHRWLRLADASDGIAVANDSTYGWDITRHQGERRGTWSLVRASLARAARFPDPNQDQGQHEWNFALEPGATVLEAVQLGQQLNLTQREVSGSIDPLLRLEGAVIESVSLAPDQSGDVVVRAYEATGGVSRAKLTFPGATSVRGVDLRYRDSKRAIDVLRTASGWEFELAPFEIATLRVEVNR